MKWDDETVKALRFIIHKTLADQTNGGDKEAQRMANSKFRIQLGATPGTSQPPAQPKPDNGKQDSELRVMMRIPSSIRCFREASPSVKHEIGDMIDILSTQEEEASHIAYDKDNFNRLGKIAHRHATHGHRSSPGPDIADLTNEHDKDLEERANSRLLRSEEDSTIWIKWGLDPGHPESKETPRSRSRPPQRQDQAHHSCGHQAMRMEDVNLTMIKQDQESP